MVAPLLLVHGIFHYAANMLPIASDADPVRSLIESRSLRWRSFWLAYAAMYVLLLSTPALSQSGPAIPADRRFAAKYSC